MSKIVYSYVERKSKLIIGSDIFTMDNLVFSVEKDFVVVRVSCDGAGNEYKFPVALLISFLSTKAGCEDELFRKDDFKKK